MPPEYPQLQKLLQGYLNQDWDLSYDSEEAAIRDFARTNWQADVEALQTEIGAFLTHHENGLLSAMDGRIKPEIYFETNDEVAAFLQGAQGFLSEELASDRVRQQPARRGNWLRHLFSKPG